MSGQGFRVVIVDDHALFRSGLALLLARDRRILVVAQGATSEDALSLSQQHLPDVLLLDIELDGVSAESTIRRLQRLVPSVAVVVLTMHRDSVLRKHLLRAGAIDYLTKDIQGGDLIERLVVASGRSRSLPSRSMPVSPVRGLLTDREMQVLRMIEQGMSNREIGLRLSITEGTVKRHTSNLYTRLGASSRIDAIRKANLLGLM